MSTTESSSETTLIKLPLIEKKTRWEIKNNHKFKNGIDEVYVYRQLLYYTVFLEALERMLI